jgi:hypothetical protein
MTSNQKVLYRWAYSIHSHFGELGYWQVLNLALFSLGVVMARSCQVNVVAEELSFAGKADSVARRFKRLLANEGLDMGQLLPLWVKWVLSSFAGTDIYLLVDETKLGQRIGVMMISLAYRGHAIPLLWCCYREGIASAYPSMGQVDLIMQMLAQIKPCIPPECHVWVLADQGIGNSSALMRKLKCAGWRFLLRVQEASMFTTRSGMRFRLGEMATRTGSAQGVLYTRGRMVVGILHIIWSAEYEQPWFLFTNDPTLRGQSYAYRAWQEQSFRDLKSGGWHWDKSFIRDPEHMQRLLLILALAYAWMATLGTLSATLPPVLLRQIVGADEAKFSVFRHGIRVYKRLCAIAVDRIHTNLFFIPKTTAHPLLC